MFVRFEVQYIQMRRALFTLILFTVSYLSFSQVAIPPLQGWRVHLPFHSNTTITEGGDYVYAGSKSGVFRFDKTANQAEILSKVNGLSDVEVSKLVYDEQSNTLMILYQSGDIDLLQDNLFYNIPDIRQQNIIGGKTINDITVHDGFAYLACSFGIVKIDIAKKRVVDSYQNLGPNGSNMEFFDVAFFDNNILAAGSDGIYAASLSSPNLSDFNFWSRIKTSTYSPDMITFNGTLYAVIDSVLNTYDGIAWSAFVPEQRGLFYELKICNNQLLIVKDRSLMSIDASGVRHPRTEQGAIDAIISKEGEDYYAVQTMGLIAHRNSGEVQYIAPNGPWGSTALKFAYDYKNEALWGMAGTVNGFGTSVGWGQAYNNNKFYYLKSNFWYNEVYNPDPRLANARDFIDVVIDPVTNNKMLASFGMGLFEMNGSQVVNVFTESNSSLQLVNSPLPVNPLMVSGLSYDQRNNLWVTNFGAPNPISVKTQAGQWYSFALPSSIDNRIGYITCDDAGTKWIIQTRGQGLIAFNENNSFGSASDDKVRLLTKDPNNGALPSTNVLCITKDANGELWIGTDYGLCIISNPSQVFSSTVFKSRQIVLPGSSFNSVLLGTDVIFCIKTDAANRKWIGTRNGVWLLSADGYTVINNFTTENSPLLSNTVYEIGIDEKTGEVFFATEKGIISFVGTATAGADKHSNVLVYPNPVKPEYTGLIAIKGLVQNANVKITDIAGNLVFETKANGGTATWDGKNFNGKRASTGVYIVYSSNDDGTETFATKILFIN